MLPVTWRRACRVRDVPAERGWPVKLGGRRIAIFYVEGELSAVDNVCLHAGSPLDDGLVEGSCVTCPWHGWRYDLRTGEHLTIVGPRPGLRRYRVRTEGDYVLVDV